MTGFGGRARARARARGAADYDYAYEHAYEHGYGYEIAYACPAVIRWFLLAAWLLATACRSQPAVQPVDIVLGVDVCDYCHMVIDDPDRAAEWIADGGQVHRFDEPGDLVAWLTRQERGAGRAFVADAAGSGWIDAEQASFVTGAVRTAMGSGIVAYRDRARADSVVAERGGAVVDWNTLRNEGVTDAGAH